ncbi:MAG: J domain-containing protein [Actinomycetota bacterium]
MADSAVGASPGRREPPAGGEATTCPADVIIDLTAGSGWTQRIAGDPVCSAELAERFRVRAARREAQQELLRLRDRHWSAERVLEESRRQIEWWEHPEADPYAVLGLLPGASMDEAAAARRSVAQACHPDRLGPGDDPDDAVRRMVAANAAYDRLRRALHPVW